MEELIIVAKSNNLNWTICEPCDAEEEKKKAKEHFEDELSTAIENQKDSPSNELWQREIDYCRLTLSEGFEAITFEEYRKREKRNGAQEKSER